MDQRWVPSRQTVRDMDYFSRSNDSNVVKQLLKIKNRIYKFYTIKKYYL